jgi:hypothetical protein
LIEFALLSLYALSFQHRFAIDTSATEPQNAPPGERASPHRSALAGCLASGLENSRFSIEAVTEVTQKCC